MTRTDARIDALYESWKWAPYPMTLDELAAGIGITIQGVQHIERRALAKLRKALAHLDCMGEP